MYKGIGKTLGKWKALLCLGGVYLLAGNALPAIPVGPGEINSTDTGDKQRIFQFLNTASPELISFLQRIGVLTENTPTSKMLATSMECWSYAPSASMPITSVSIDLCSALQIRNDAKGTIQCAVFPFGGAQFASWECDAPLDGLRTRSLPSGGIKRCISNGMKVTLENPPVNFQLLVFFPEPHPIIYILHYNIVITPSVNPQMQHPQHTWNGRQIPSVPFSPTSGNYGPPKGNPPQLTPNMPFQAQQYPVQGAFYPQGSQPFQQGQLQPLNQNQKELEKKIIIISQRLKTASDDLDEWNRLPPYP
ncbi:MAG: hypothetical protein LBG98_00410, partial [Puniceicoccales bacterium]|nr:hypothetical protein [Puniceicoccales bacterium]